MTAQHPALIAPQKASAPVHEHGWLLQSRHPTSEGIVIYVRCADCGAHRVDLQAHRSDPPMSISRASALFSDPQAGAARR